MLRFVLFFTVLALATANLNFPLKASANTDAGDGIVNGRLAFFQKLEDGPVSFVLKFSGLKPGMHGFHIHENAVKNHDCMTAGAHLNLNGNTHHGKTEVEFRHLGDLGNIIADEEGNVDFVADDPLIKLHGPSSIIGKSFVVHEQRDDLGLGGDEESKKTGNSGGRVACGTITMMN